MIKSILALSIISLIILSTFVMGAGSSSGGNQRPSSWSEERQANLCNTDSDCVIKKVISCCSNDLCVHVNDDIISPRASPCYCQSYTFPDDTSCVCKENSICGSSTTSNQGTAATCEDKATPKERIKCRFENKEIAVKEARTTVEEACRDSNKKEACQTLYKRSAQCYNETNPITKKKCLLKESGININAGGTFRAAPDETKRNYVILLLYDLQEKIEKKVDEGKITTEQAANLVTKIVEIKKLILSGAKRSEVAPKIKEFKVEYRQIISEEKTE